MTARRIQLRRTKGWRKPAGTVTVGRPSRWGNPFSLDGAIEHGFATTREEARKVAVEFFRNWLAGWDPGENDVYRHGPQVYDRRWMRDHLAELRGKNLACWCPPGPCHADVLLELANTTAGATA